MNGILDLAPITVDEDGKCIILKHGDNWTTMDSVISVKKVSVTDDLSAQEEALSMELITDEQYEDPSTISESLYLWRYDDDMTSEWFDNEADAYKAFDDAVEYFFEDLALGLDDELFSDNSSMPYAWMYEGVDEGDRKETTPDQFTDYLITTIDLDPDKPFMTLELAQWLVNRWKQLLPSSFAGLFAEYAMLESDAGAVNIYMPHSVKAQAEYLASKLNIKDNRGNPSISSLIAKLVATEIAKPTTAATEIEYEITSDMIEAYEPVTLEGISSVVDEWDYEGWTLKTELSGDEVRVYAYRDGSEDNQPSKYADWTMVTDDYGYIVVAQEIKK